MILSAKPTPARAGRRASSIVGALALVSAALTGCTPGPEPTTTPTPAFTSEAEAFAAAEEVYRAYNDAGNARLNNTTDADPQEFLVGRALEGDIDAQNSLEAQGLHLVGTVVISAFHGTSLKARNAAATVTTLVCLNVSGIHVVDDTGQDVTPVQRADIVAQQVTFVSVKDTLRISDESA